MKWKYLLLALIILVSTQTVYAQSFDLVVTRGDILVDSLVAQVYTQAGGVPLIVTGRGGFTPDIRTELISYRKQGSSKALIIGGNDAVPPYIETDLEIMNYTVERLWDVDRYGTSAKVAETLWERSDTVVISPGDQKGNFMLAAQTAMDNKAPLLFTESNNLNQQSKSAIISLQASRLILMGNLSKNVIDELENLGGVEQTTLTLVRPKAPSSTGIFVVGIIIGFLVLFLISSIWGSEFLEKKGK